jgi:hypothetical protein
MKYYFNIRLQKLFKFFFYDSNTIKLGRWCHKGVKNCDENVIEKKINFALLDNNLCNKPKKF